MDRRSKAEVAKRDLLRLEITPLVIELRNQGHGIRAVARQLATRGIVATKRDVWLITRQHPEIRLVSGGRKKRTDLDAAITELYQRGYGVDSITLVLRKRGVDIKTARVRAICKRLGLATSIKQRPGHAARIAGANVARAAEARERTPACELRAERERVAALGLRYEDDPRAVPSEGPLRVLPEFAVSLIGNPW